MNRELAMTYISRAMDGELPERQRQALEDYLRQHPADAELRESWAAIGNLLREESALAPSPDPEAAWVDIRRAIRTAPAEAAAERAPWFVRWAVPLAAAALVVIAVGIRARMDTRGAPVQVARVAAPPATGASKVDWVESGLPDASTMVYEDDATGVTVVWLMVPDAPADGAGAT